MSAIQTLAVIAIAAGLTLLLRAFLLIRADGGAESRRTRRRVAGAFLVFGAALLERLLIGELNNAVVIAGMLMLGIPGLVLLYLGTRRAA